MTTEKIISQDAARKLHDPEAVAARREAKYQAWKKRKGL